MDKDSDPRSVMFAQVVYRMREEMPANIQYVQLQAKITRAKFLALVNEGFTEAQAIELCKA